MANLEPMRQDSDRGPLGPSHVRASDVDRRRVVAELQRHYVDGRLSQDELDERIGRTLAARTLGDLDAELHDLPRAAVSQSLPSEPASPPEAGPDDASFAGPWSDGSFRAHATSYLLVMALLVAIWLLTSPGGYFWPVWPMLGWGFGLAAHGLFGAGSKRARRRAGGRERQRSPEPGGR